MAMLKVLIILLLFAPAALATEQPPVFTDSDLGKYRSAGDDAPGQRVYKRNEQPVSPAESALSGMKRRKDAVVKENSDYIEGQYQWMLSDCEKYKDEMRKECLWRSKEWRKEDLKRVEDLREFLSK